MQINNIEEQLNDGLDCLKIKITKNQQEQILSYLSMLVKWNNTYNLTAIKTKDAMINNHILDSLTILPYINNKNILDVGSGGGFPGVPIAIVDNSLHVTLLDASNKKTSFLNQVKIELKLDNIDIVNSRIENFVNYKFDIIVSRAFADLNDFVSISEHLLSKNGIWIAMKGLYPYEELDNLPDDIEVVKVEEATFKDIKGQRHIVVMKRKDNI